ncbi:hypothetical protein ACLMJK_004592 [Lecanora helva]
MESQSSLVPRTLLNLLHNSLILNQISPYLGITNLFALAAASKSFKLLIYGTPGVFRYTNLSNALSYVAYSDFGNESDVAPDEFLSTDDYYALPLRKIFRIFQGRNILQDIRTLILDGLPVPLSLLQQILCNDAYNLRILSLRGVKELGDEKLIQILRHIVRPSRLEGTPNLKGLYYFTPLDVSADFMAADLLHRVPGIGVTNALGAQLGAGTSLSSGALHRQLVQSSWHPSNPWYGARGQLVRLDAQVSEQWALLLLACEGLVAFDITLCCMNINHPNQSPQLATVSLRGCQKCGSCPEGPACPGTSPQKDLPLLTPPPTHQSSVKSAQRLYTNGYPYPALISRCRMCLKDRWCERCNVWWCESCYSIPSKRDRASMLRGPPMSEPSIKVHNNLCVSKCLMDEMLNGVGEGGMWG